MMGRAALACPFCFMAAMGGGGRNKEQKKRVYLRSVYEKVVSLQFDYNEKVCRISIAIAVVL